MCAPFQPPEPRRNTYTIHTRMEMHHRMTTHPNEFEYVRSDTSDTEDIQHVPSGLRCPWNADIGCHDTSMWF
jgi:hypothetical protein